jgi:hypothetical protein
MRLASQPGRMTFAKTMIEFAAHDSINSRRFDCGKTDGPMKLKITVAIGRDFRRSDALSREE